MIRGHLGQRLRLEALEDRCVPAGVLADYAVTQDWGSGFQGQIKLLNQQTTSVTNWKLEFDYTASISSIWDAKVTSKVGNHYTVTNAGWNSTLAAGGAVQFGFVAGPGNTGQKPTGYKLNGVPLDGGTPAVPALSVTDVSLVEGHLGATPAVFTVQLSAPSTQTVTVAYTTANGTAQSGSDYTAKSGTLTFAPGTTQVTVSVPVLGDAAVESDETFKLVLSSAAGATLADGEGVGTIRNDDAHPGTGDFVFRVVSDWGSGFTGEISARNSSTAALNNWTLEFDFAGTITSVWDAKVVSRVGNHFTLTHADWNDSIPAGGTVKFGFNATPGNVATGPGNYLLKGTGGSTGTPAPPPAQASPWPQNVSAPYVDTTLWPTYDFLAAARSTGLRYFTLAFITADPTTRPAWGGYADYAANNGGTFDTWMKGQISGLRALGGDVMVSFGGASGRELAEVITDIGALKSAYRRVIDAYNLTHLDFDIEGAATADRASVDRRSRALAELQTEYRAAGKELQIWLTLPVLPTGLTPDGVYVVRSARTHGLALAGVNIMTMDYGDSAAPNPNGKMGDYAIQAAESLYSQLATVYGTSKTSGQLWQLVGLTPMIGLNDVTTEVFDQQEASEVLAFARLKDIGRLSLWSINRDKQNAAGRIGYVDLHSSSILQSPLEFSLLFNRFTGT